MSICSRRAPFLFSCLFLLILLIPTISFAERQTVFNMTDDSINALSAQCGKLVKKAQQSKAKLAEAVGKYDTCTDEIYLYSVRP